MPLPKLEDFYQAGDFEPNLERGLWTMRERRMCAEARRGELMAISGERHGTCPLTYTVESFLIMVPSCYEGH